MSTDYRNSLTSNDWKKIIVGFIAGFVIYFTLVFISYRSYNCSSNDFRESVNCLISIPPFERIYIVLFSLIFGFFIQEIDDSLILVGYNILATGSSMLLFYLYIQIITNTLFLFDTFAFIFSNFSIIFISSLFGQGLSNVIYSKIIKERKSKTRQKNYGQFSDII